MQQIAAYPQPNNASGPSGDSRKLIEDLYNYLDVVKRGWRLIALCVIVSLTAAVVFLARTETVYKSSARLLVIQQGAGRPIQVAGGGDPFQNLQGSNESLSTHLMIIRSPIIVEQAVVSSGLKSDSIPSVLASLTAKLPDPSAKIIELTYKAESAAVAKGVIEGVVDSYNRFLKNNYQKNTNEVISLILKARDDLNSELKALEADFLKYRQKNPAYSADDKGRTFISRRLDQWDQAMNQVLARSLQLKSQLELGRKLSGEGVDQATITSALNQLGVLGVSSSQIAPPPSGTPTMDEATYEGVLRALAEVETRRKTSDLLLTHLRREQRGLGQSRGLSDRDAARTFYADPEVAAVQSRLKDAQAKLGNIARLSRSPSDPSVVAARRRVDGLQAEIQRLWAEQRPEIEANFATDSNPELTAAVRKAEAELVTTKAREAALNERLQQLAAEELPKLRDEHARLQASHGEGHPLVLQAEKKVARIEAGAGRQEAARSGGKNDALLDSIARSLESTEAMRQDLQKKFEEDLAASKKTEMSQLEEVNLRNNLERHRTLFNSVVDQLKQAQLVSDFGSVSAQTINPTTVSAERPAFLMVLMVALFAGCGFGVLGAFVADLLDPRVRTMAEIRKLIDLPVIGMIPQLDADASPTTGGVGLLSHDTPRSALAESYKSTRTNLEFIRRNRRAQVLLITSPHPGDGKSTTASNLGIALANTGRRILLVDGDLRKPSLHGMYGLSRKHGFSDVIGGGGSICQLAVPTLVDNLDLLSTGPDVPNPAELLASQRLGELFDDARPAYDTIIVDSSPLLAVTDPSIIAAVADGVILVVRVTSTRRHDIERTTELLKTLGVPVLGMVVNGVTREQMGYGYGYGYGGYGSGYGTNGSPYAPVAGLTNGENGNAARHPRPASCANGSVEHVRKPSGPETVG